MLAFRLYKTYIFVDRVFTAPVLDCAFRKDIKDLPRSRENFETKLIVAMTFRHLTEIILSMLCLHRAVFRRRQCRWFSLRQRFLG